MVSGNELAPAGRVAQSPLLDTVRIQMDHRGLLVAGCSTTGVGFCALLSSHEMIYADTIWTSRLDEDGAGCGGFRRWRGPCTGFLEVGICRDDLIFLAAELDLHNFLSPFCNFYATRSSSLCNFVFPLLRRVIFRLYSISPVVYDLCFLSRRINKNWNLSGLIFASTFEMSIDPNDRYFTGGQGGHFRECYFRFMVHPRTRYEVIKRKAARIGIQLKRPIYTLKKYRP